MAPVRILIFAYCLSLQVARAMNTNLLALSARICFYKNSKLFGLFLIWNLCSFLKKTFPALQPLTPSSMEERIAELNRQSMEARGKLLQLIEQQKLIGLNPPSPPVSPIQSPLRAWTG